MRGKGISMQRYILFWEDVVALKRAVFFFEFLVFLVQTILSCHSTEPSGDVT